MVNQTVSSQTTSLIRQRRPGITTAVILTPEGVTVLRPLVVYRCSRPGNRSTGNGCTSELALHTTHLVVGMSTYDFFKKRPVLQLAVSQNFANEALACNFL